MPESPKLGKSAAMVWKFFDSSGTILFQDRRVCGKPEISSTFSPLPARSNAIFFASAFASKEEAAAVALSPTLMPKAPANRPARSRSARRCSKALPARHSNFCGAVFVVGVMVLLYVRDGARRPAVSDFFEAATGRGKTVGDLQRVERAVQLQRVDAFAVGDQPAGYIDLARRAARFEAE